MSAPQWRDEMAERFAVWNEIIAAAAARKTHSATKFRTKPTQNRLHHKHSQIR
jgi:hypothetical protein